MYSYYEFVYIFIMYICVYKYINNIYKYGCKICYVVLRIDRKDDRYIYMYVCIYSISMDVLNMLC